MFFTCFVILRKKHKSKVVFTFLEMVGSVGRIQDFLVLLLDGWGRGLGLGVGFRKLNCVYT